MARRPQSFGDRKAELLLEFCVEGVALSAQSKNRTRLRAWQERIAKQANRTFGSEAMFEGSIEIRLTEFSEARSIDRDMGAHLSTPPARDTDAVTVRVRSLERREVLNVARRYRREGYKVSGPDKWDTRPTFLGNFVPDLIAERHDDKVVIEVKRAPAVRGANDLPVLAERVAAQPGWRFELVAFPDAAKATVPDLRWGGEQIERLLDRGFPKPAFVFVYAMIENIIMYASSLQDMELVLRPSSEIVRGLVVQGIINEDARRRIDVARVRRDAIVHEGSEPAPTRADVEELMKLGYELEREVSLAGAA